MNPIRIARLRDSDAAHARTLFARMAEIFDEPCESRSIASLEQLLASDTFWAIAAFSGEEIVGGLTAHTLPMSRSESSELFIYDIAVHADYQRRGIGRALVKAIRELAAALTIRDSFVLADDEDTHALDFYKAIGAAPSPVTMFDFRSQD